MAYYIIITEVTRSRATGCTVRYELRDDTMTPNSVIESGSIGLEFPITGTATERRTAIRDTLIQNFQFILSRTQMADNDFNAVQSNLVGLRYPA